MFRITDRLFIANKIDLSSLVTNPAHIIFLSPWKELVHQTDLEGKIKSLDQIQESGIGKRNLFELKNEEIPHYSIDEFNKIVQLIDQYQKEDLIVVSTHGQSRAPSLVLLWMAFYAKKISTSSFGAARLDFSRHFPNYVPWPGMVIFLTQEWDVFNNRSHQDTKSR